ncbi:uncharacterized protein LOC135486256 isoform X2 [Lineus longissimus]
MASMKTEHSMICVICFEERDKLKTVGECKHNFCFSCLFKHIVKHCNGQMFPCPSCQENCLLPRDELNGLADFTGEEEDVYFDCTTTHGEPCEEGDFVREPSENSGAVRELGEACAAVEELDVDIGAVRNCSEECGAVMELDPKSGAEREIDVDSGAVKELVEKFGAVMELGAECGALKEVESTEPVTDLTDTVGMNCQICRHVGKTARAANLCPECDQLYLCQKCARLHGSNPATKMHAVVQLKRDLMCDEHKAPLTSYCCTCSKAVCKICVMMNHGHHHVEKLGNLILWKVEEVNVALREREKDLERLRLQEAQLVALKVDALALDKQVALIEAIESHAEKCIHEIVTWKEILKAEVKRDFKVIKEVPEVLKDVSDSVTNLRWGVSSVSEKLSKVNQQASVLDTLTSMHHDLDMMQAVPQAHEGVVDTVLCGLYQTPDYFIPSEMPSTIGQLFQSATDISKASLPVLVQVEQKTDLSGRLESMSSWASVPTVLTTPTNNYAVDRVKQVVFRLTVAPGNMEEFMIPLVGDLNDEQVDLTTVIDMINVIFEQAIAESNFTYTGARMCDWFVRDYKPKTNGEPIKFLGLLMKRCQVEQEKSQILAQENPTRLQGFTLFMAELFQNVKIVAQGGEERIEVLGKKLRELVRTLLTHPSDSNLKCVVRILKCTGAVLEDTERLLTGQALDMDNLITFCLQQAMSPHASESARAMLKKVADIRSTNWGRIESAPVQVVAPPQPRAPSPFTQSDPVFFDPYGRMITREEAGFAEGELEYSFGDGYPDEWSSQDLQYQEQEFDPSFDNGYLDTEIDSEIADAFEQFLIETQQAI